VFAKWVIYRLKHTPALLSVVCFWDGVSLTLLRLASNFQSSCTYLLSYRDYRHVSPDLEGSLYITARLLKEGAYFGLNLEDVSRKVHNFVGSQSHFLTGPWFGDGGVCDSPEGNQDPLTNQGHWLWNAFCWLSRIIGLLHTLSLLWYIFRVLVIPIMIEEA
jgi:hypothetical protein